MCHIDLQPFATQSANDFQRLASAAAIEDIGESSKDDGVGASGSWRRTGQQAQCLFEAWYIQLS